MVKKQKKEGGFAFLSLSKTLQHQRLYFDQTGRFGSQRQC
jgi:hypothetical protein